MDQKTQIAAVGQFHSGYTQEDGAASGALSSNSIVPNLRRYVNTKIDTSDLDYWIAYHLAQFWYHDERNERYAAEEHADEYRRFWNIRARLVALAGGAA